MDNLVKVTWFDASYDECGRVPLIHASTLQPYTNYTVGMIAYECEDYITLAMEKCVPMEKDKPELYMALCCIPMNCVVKIETLEVSGTTML